MCVRVNILQMMTHLQMRLRLVRCITHAIFAHFVQIVFALLTGSEALLVGMLGHRTHHVSRLKRIKSPHPTTPPALDTTAATTTTTTTKTHARTRTRKTLLCIQCMYLRLQMQCQ